MSMKKGEELMKQLERAKQARQRLPVESISGLHLAVQINLIQEKLGAKGSVYSDPNGDWLLVMASTDPNVETAER